MQQSHLLRNIDRVWLKPNYLRHCNRSISECGQPHQNCRCFIDGTTRPICRLSINQRILFSGHKLKHGLKFQSVVIPNGLIANLYGLLLLLLEREREMFYLTTHSTHFIYGYMASDIWLRTILIVRKQSRCRHIGYSYRLTARARRFWAHAVRAYKTP